MSLFFDARWIGAHGIGRYASELLNKTGFDALPLTGSPLSPIDPIRLGLALRRLKACHYFSPGFNVPLGHRCEISLTIHDLIHLEVPSERTPAKVFYYEKLLKPALKKTRCLFTDSNFSKDRLALWGGLDPEKITVAGCGVSSVFTPDGPSWPHQRRYLLFVGNLKPYKNLEGLLQAFKDAGLHTDFDLLMPGRLSVELKRKIERLQLGPCVFALGCLKEEALAALYRGASALVVPSFYEGFGLPVAEAMASGTPVLSSRLTSLPEVGGKAALWFDPRDHEEFVTVLQTVHNHQELRRLRLAGFEQARRHDWAKVADTVKTQIEATRP